MSDTFIVGADGALGRVLVAALGATPVLLRHPGGALDAQVPELARARVVINVAGPRVWPGLGWADYLREHVGTASAVARAMPPGSHLIHFSSASVYGGYRPGLVGPQTPEEPASFPNPSYAWAKLAGEHAARAIGRERGLRVSVLRPAMVYGPGVTSALDTLLKLARRGVLLDLAPGSARQSCLHLSLLVAVLKALAAREAPLDGPHPVADPFVFTNAELVQAIAGGQRKLRLPVPLGAAEAALRRWPLFPDRDGPSALASLAFLGLDVAFDVAPLLQATGLAAGPFSRELTLDAYLREAR